ncbi:MAG TPA: cobaltochelatase subunit CobN, partial [Anaerolineae bacterium]|nr:cobaltochelatase subunit CobN [Anaerolineae bacterium]
MSNSKPARRERNYVVRPDGKPINVPRNRGQLFVCENGCCCGHTDRGFAPVPHDLYYTEWERRKLRHKVHLNHAGCLGPCALANVTLLLFDGRPIWFHSVNSERLILVIFDYIEAMLAADRYLPPPPVLADHVFNGFAWDGGEAAKTQGHEESAVSVPYLSSPQTEEILALSEKHILFLTHADTDLLALSQAAADLPSDFPQVRGLNLSSLPTTAHVDEFIRTELAEVQVMVLRSLGGRQGFMHGFDRLVQAAKRSGKDVICVPGTEGLDPELTAHSNVAVPVIHDVYRYLHFGGVDNMRQMLFFLADHLLAGGWGYDQPVEQPRHGVYKPDKWRAGGLEDIVPPGYWKVGELKADNDEQHRSKIQNHLSPDGEKPKIQNPPTIGILFYRSHWLSGNTAFVDALIEAIETVGGKALPVFTTSLKERSEAQIASSPHLSSSQPAAFQYFYDDQDCLLVDTIISTISFAMGGVNPDGATSAGWNVAALEVLGVPVLQAISSGMAEEEWRLSQRGLRPLDVAMNVALPEFDGRIITVPISFKGEVKVRGGQEAQKGCGHNSTCDCDSVQGLRVKVQHYVPIPDRVQAVAKLAMRYATLRYKPNADKRIVFILTNSPGKASRIGNAVGLDTPASLMGLFERMQNVGYRLENVPESGDALLHELIARCSYDVERLTESQLARAAGRVPVETYAGWFSELTGHQQTRMQQQWQAPPGEAYVHLDSRGRGQHIALAGLDLGNVFVALQPPRGYNMDPNAIYHTPELPPTHNYYALYKWLITPQAEGGWGADAIVHMGKHGTLEWLPGKGVGLSTDCFPDAFLADLPLIYPFIINNPGEGAQAKRRAHAVVVDHMIPPMTSADVYGELALLTQLVDEYYQVEQMDPAKLPYIQQQIWQLMQKANLDKDIAQMMRLVNHGDHQHEWDGTYTDDGTPLTLAEMNATDFGHLLEDVDGYLCELGSLQIRDGLHILGHIPEGEQLCNLLRALTRIPNGDIPSLRAEIATWLGFDLDALLANRGKRVASGEWRVANGEVIHVCRTHADVIEFIDTLSLHLLQRLEAANFATSEINSAITAILGASQSKIQNHLSPDGKKSKIQNVLAFVCETLVPLIRRNEEEIDHLINALNGGYVPAGPAGAPTRGMAHILPTGRNFYAVDPQAIPSQAAWRVGNQLAEELLERYRVEE